MKISNFSAMNLAPALLKALHEMKFSKMTPVQTECIPIILAGKDLIGQSKTGSGKTAAFILPLLQKINLNLTQPQALILFPTRELCDQVLEEVRKFSKFLSNFKSIALVGGQPYVAQENELRGGVQLLLGTPGRVLEHFKNGNIEISRLRILVLDEADRLLEDGFTEELNEIVSYLPTTRQTLFFSATFPAAIDQLSRDLQNNAEHVIVDPGNLLSSTIQQFLYQSEKPEKTATLLKILEEHPSPCTLIFCRTKASVDEIGRLLNQQGTQCRILHANLKQAERDRTVSEFRNGKLQVLVATDVAARGLDIDKLELVVNFDLPPSADIYIHRIGRTGRAGRSGKAVSIGTAYETELITSIEAATGQPMLRPRS